MSLYILNFGNDLRFLLLEHEAWNEGVEAPNFEQPDMNSSLCHP